MLDALWQNYGQATIEVIAAGAVTLSAIWEAAWKLSGAVENAKWLTTTFDGTNDLMPLYENTGFLRSLHLTYLGQADLPGSDAPKNPLSPPAGKGNVADTPTSNDRGHTPKPSRGTPRNPSAQRRATGGTTDAGEKKAPRRKR